MDDKVTKYFEEHAANPNYASNRMARWYTRLSNGQYASIQIDKAKGRFEGKLEDTYNITLSIDDSLKNIKEFFLKNHKSKSWNKIKGKGGSEGLLWAKGLLSEIIKGGHLGDGFVEIYGSDSKRFNVYKKALSKIGFEQWIDQDGDEFLARRIESDHLYSMDFRNKKVKNVGIDAFLQAKISQVQKVTGASYQTLTGFHGTTRDKPAFMIDGFNVFEGMKNKKLVLGAGHYLSGTTDLASIYAKDAGNIFKVKVSGNIIDLRHGFKNTEEDIERLAPFHDLLGGKEKVKTFLSNAGENGYSGTSVFNRMAEGFRGSQSDINMHTVLNKELSSRGYDGVAVLKRHESGVTDKNTIFNIFNNDAIKEIEQVHPPVSTNAVNAINSAVNTGLHNSGTVALNAIEHTGMSGASRVANRQAIEATMNVATNAVKSAGNMTGKGSTAKILSRVLR